MRRSLRVLPTRNGKFVGKLGHGNFLQRKPVHPRPRSSRREEALIYVAFSLSLRSEKIRDQRVLIPALQDILTDPGFSEIHPMVEFVLFKITGTHGMMLKFQRDYRSVFDGK